MAGAVFGEFGMVAGAQKLVFFNDMFDGSRNSTGNRTSPKLTELSVSDRPRETTEASGYGKFIHADGDIYEAAASRQTGFLENMLKN